MPTEAGNIQIIDAVKLSIKLMVKSTKVLFLFHFQPFNRLNTPFMTDSWFLET